MDEYIEKEAALKLMRPWSLETGATIGRHSGLVDTLMVEIDKLPAADVRENVPPQTKGDEIRAMSDEELTEWCHAYSFGCPPVECRDEDCAGCWLDWLKSPAEGGSDDG